MTISSRTPEGARFQCPICAIYARLEPCEPGQDSVCPACGQLLWLFRDQLTEQINFETLLKDDLGFDSFDLIEYVMEIEDKFGITISEEVAESFRSVGDIIAYIRRQQERE